MVKHEKALRRPFRWVRAFGLAACVMLCAPLSARAQSPEESALRALLERFFSAYRAKDLEGVMALWSKGSSDSEAGKDALGRDFVAQEKQGLKNLSVGRLTVEGERASARLAVELGGTAPEPGGPVRLNRTAHFVKEGGAWKVRGYAPSEEELAAELVAAAGGEREALLEKEKELVTAELVKALLARGRSLFMRGELTPALAAFDLALGLAEKMGDKAGAIVALRQMGNILGSQGSYTQALEFSRRSLKLAEEAGDKQGAAAALNSMGNMLDWLGEASSAMEHYQRSLAIASEIQDPWLLPILHNNIGLMYKSQGDAMRALEYIQTSLRLAEASKDSVSILRALHNIGIVHAGQGNYEQAFEYYQKSFAISEQLGAKSFAPAVLGNMGLSHSKRGNSALALEYHHKALERAQEIGDKEVIAGSLNNIGDVYGNLGDYARALEHFRKGLVLAEEMGNKVLVVNAHADIAEAHLRLGEYHKAVEYAERSAALALQANLQEQVPYSRTLSGKAHLALGELEPARRSLLEAISAVERLRSQVAGGERDRQRFFERQVEPYYVMVDLLLTRRDDFQALTYAERAKGRVLLDVLSSGRVDISKAMTAGEKTRESALSGEVNRLNSEIFRANSEQSPDPARLKELDGRLQRARFEYESFQTDLYAAHPELKLRRGESPSLTPEQLASLLPDAKTALLEFVVGENASYLFAVTRGAGRNAAVELKTYKLNVKAKELAAQVEDVRKRLSERNLDFSEQARGLYDLLLGPAREQLRGKTLLCIVPDGVLWELPFQALQPRDGAYLIEDHAVFYTPSLSVLHGMAKLSGRGRGVATAPGSRQPVLLAFGNPSLGQHTVEFVRSVYRGEKLGPLPEAEGEVRALEELYTPSRSRIYVRDEAREERAKAEVGGYRVLHFATHGVLDDRNPMYSHVLLSQAGVGAGEDGLLHAWEVMKLDLKADIVVMSACQTARGKLGAGEGVIGMGWALFVAGSPTAVLSLWKVESSSTAELMVGFHRHLMAQGAGRGVGRRKADALRAASLELMKDGRFRHPFYWAGFVMVGNGM
jgi:CHAT domain-containing protein/Tfp pilus assembly protein PilF